MIGEVRDVGDEWRAAVGACGGDPVAARTSAAELVGRYREPHRRYHTLRHVAAVLRDGAMLADHLDLDADERAVVALSACAHDVVYDARPGDDERSSAAWAAAALGAAGVAAHTVQRVEHLVLLTISHDSDPTDRAASALLDADLAILAAGARDYAAYVKDVRAEYAAVTDGQWRTGRVAVLRGLMGRSRLFLSDPAYARWETAARRNVETELAGLDPV